MPWCYFKDLNPDDTRKPTDKSTNFLEESAESCHCKHTVNQQTSQYYEGVLSESVKRDRSCLPTRKSLKVLMLSHAMEAVFKITIKKDRLSPLRAVILVVTLSLIVGLLSEIIDTKRSHETIDSAASVAHALRAITVLSEASDIEEELTPLRALL